MYEWGNRSKQRMKGVEPLLRECATAALYSSKYDMTIPWMGGLRTAEQQNRIFKTGNSQLDGHNKRSYHQTGKALDIIPVEGGYTNDKAFRHFAACMFTEWQKMNTGLILEWGGHWENFIDTPHWQIR